MENLTEYISLKLHEVPEYKTPYILMAFYPVGASSFDVTGEKAFGIIQPFLAANALTFEDVTILYYFSTSNRGDELNEWVFDSYLGKYIGNRIVPISFLEVSKDVKDLHDVILSGIAENVVQVSGEVYV
jgi:hypothetical protein